MKWWIESFISHTRWDQIPIYVAVLANFSLWLFLFAIVAEHHGFATVELVRATNSLGYLFLAMAFIPFAYGIGGIVKDGRARWFA